MDYDAAAGEIFLYHGTNCYRRWEINRSGAIEPGRNNYSFLCIKAADAYTYARTACLRDVHSGCINSLICEPVVLKVKFNARTWMQVDFIQELNPGDNDPLSLSAAVLGPIAAANIIDVLHCTHGRRLANESIRSFEDGTLIAGIQQLKEKLGDHRVDAWVLKKLGLFTQKVNTKLSGGEMPDLTEDHVLRRLRQVRA